MIKEEKKKSKEKKVTGSCLKMKCALCKKEVYLPYRCSYCGQYFCDDHRLPEQHLCPDPPDARANKRTKIRIKR